MIRIIRSLAFSAISVLVLTSCSFFSNTTSDSSQKVEPTASLSQLAKIELTVQVDTSVPYNTLGQVIKYAFTIKNTGSTGVPAGAPGNVTVSGATVTCPDVTTVGNKDVTLDVNEALVCASAYLITQSDIDKGSVTSVTTATVYGISSQPVTTTVPITKPSALKLTKTANPANYDRAGQTITYTYVITNTSAATLGPAQFIVSDTGISAPINCGDASASLAPNATVTCSATYTITDVDMATASVSTNATASGGGTGPSQPASVAVTKGAAAPSNPANLTAGATITHEVAEGEWLWQIARCYGSDPNKVVLANLQLPNPGQIKPGTKITVPNIGSAGKIYGRPCVGTHTVQTGDTWVSIAQKYNADVTVLQRVNANSLTVGKVLTVPLNSATGAAVTTTTTSNPAGNCVDLTRNLTFTGIPAKPTHFNICGQTDASGKMKINTIKVYQKPEDVGPGGLVQDITLPAAIETSTLLNDANSLIVGDVNYDGNDDFRILEFQPAGPNIPYVYYIYDPISRIFVYNEAYGKITSPEFPGNSEIRSKWRESAERWGIDTFKIINNIPVLIQREMWDVTSATEARHRIRVFNADGTNQITLDEVVPIPIQ